MATKREGMRATVSWSITNGIIRSSGRREKVAGDRRGRCRVGSITVGCCCGLQAVHAHHVCGVAANREGAV